MSQEEGGQVQSSGKVIKISEIINLMKVEGKTRKEINAIYGESDAVMKAKVWSHPKLFKLKTTKVANITLVDDTEEVAQETPVAVVEDTVQDEAPVTEEVVEETVTETEAVEEAEVAQAPSATERGTW